MSAKKIYRSAKQEAIRKGLIAKLWTLARQYGMEKEDLYDAIEAEAKRKPRRGIVIYGTNWTLRRSTKRRSYGGLADGADGTLRRSTKRRSYGGQADGTNGEKRISLSSLKNWQLKQILEALFPEEKKQVKVVDIKSKKEKEKKSAKVVDVGGLYQGGNDEGL